MPKAIHDALERAADKYARRGKLKKRPNDSLEKAKNRFVFGTMKKKSKGSR